MRVLPGTFERFVQSWVVAICNNYISRCKGKSSSERVQESVHKLQRIVVLNSTKYIINNKKVE